MSIELFIVQTEDCHLPKFHQISDQSV